MTFPDREKEPPIGLATYGLWLIVGVGSAIVSFGWLYLATLVVRRAWLS